MATAPAVTNRTDPFASMNRSTGTSADATAAAADASADRFLKLLVTQMQNQDPLNPLDNAQVTTQMAQINTVNGIEKLNRTVQSLSGQFVQLQAMQTASLVGREVTVKGDALAVSDGAGRGAVSLSGAATAVRVEVLSATGQVVGSTELGARSAGTHNFSWNPATATPPVTATDGLRFRVVATSGTTPVAAETLMRDRVDAVRTGGDTLTLDLRQTGAVAYADIKAFN